MNRQALAQRLRARVAELEDAAMRDSLRGDALGRAGRILFAAQAGRAEALARRAERTTR